MAFPPPASIQCEFCGQTVEPLGVILFNNEISLWSIPECDCKDAVEYRERKKAEEEEKERRFEMEMRISHLLRDSGIKRRFSMRTFENFKQDTADRQRCYKIAKTYADKFIDFRNKGIGLYIEGTNGTGKTHLAAAIALDLIKKEIPVICKTSGDLLLDIRRTYDKGGYSEAEILDDYKKTDLLIIDDLGKENVTEWSMSMLYSILNDRYEDMKPTIITTNYRAEALAKALTPKNGDSEKSLAIISRLREVSQILVMAWEDWRVGGR